MITFKYVGSKMLNSNYIPVNLQISRPHIDMSVFFVFKYMLGYSLKSFSPSWLSRFFGWA